MILIVPSDPLNPRKPDPHFAEEYNWAFILGHEVALIDHDAVIANDPMAYAKLPEGEDAVYRGWMFSTEQYLKFEWALASIGVTLRTTTEQYQMAHEISGWYDSLVEFTPFTIRTVSDSLDDFDRLCSYFPGMSAVLRDYVKSAKHDWDEACFIPNVHDHVNARKIATRFREIRGDDFTGGYVLRQFESFVTPEIRTWWMNGESWLAGPHPDTPDEYVDLALPPGLTEAIQMLDLPFITVDLVGHKDGRVRVVEIGDGQVSDWPADGRDDVYVLTAALDGLLL